MIYGFQQKKIEKAIFFIAQKEPKSEHGEKIKKIFEWGGMTGLL